MSKLNSRPIGNVHLELFGPDGKFKEERWSNNMVLNGGLTWAADKMSVNTWSDTTSGDDGIICGGVCTSAADTQYPTLISVANPLGRLSGVKGQMMNNTLIVSDGDADFDRYDVVWMLSPASWITYPSSAPNPPGFDTERTEGVPSATPVLPGGPYTPGGTPFVAVSAVPAQPCWYAALYSYKVPALATSSQQFTEWTDRRVIVADDLGYNAISHMDFGESATAPAGGQTGPISPIYNNRPLPIDSLVHDENVVTVVGTFNAKAFTGALTEACLYAMYSATYLTRVTFDVINKGANDTLVVTWTITIADI